MKVSDRQCLHGTYYTTGGSELYDRWCTHCGALRLVGEDRWLLTTLAAAAPPTPPTIEQRAVRLAEVYKTAYQAAYGELYRESSDSDVDADVAHEIAMLLVKRELEAGDG